MGQGDSARDFGTSESMKNAGILDVFPFLPWDSTPLEPNYKVKLPPSFPSMAKENSVPLLIAAK